NTVIYYAPTILSDTGMGNSAALAATMIVGVVNVVFTVVAILLLDRVGRRVLLLTGTVGLLVGLLILGAYFSSPMLQNNYGWMALAGLLVFIMSFAIGLGPVFWLMISEIFPVGSRSKAMSLCTIFNWGANFLVAETFLTASKDIGRNGIFFLYAGLAVLSILFFVFRVPETKNRSLEEIQSDLVGEDVAPAARTA
ncbi:MAG: MFS transporter, partial [Nocardioidaceae bacterium]